MGVAVPFVHGPEGVDVYHNNTYYCAPGISAQRCGGWLGSNLRYIMPCSGKWKHLLAKTYAAPGAGQSFSFGMNVNGVGGIAAAISNLETLGSNLSEETAVSAGDIVYLRATGSAGSTDTLRWTAVLFQPDDSLIPFLTAAPTGAGTEFIGLGGHFASGASYEARVHCVVPISGKFKYLYAYSCDGVVASDTAVTLRKNSASTALAVTIPNGGLQASDLSTQVAFSAGEFADIMISSTTYEYPAVGICFVPDDPKQWWMPCAKSRVALGNAKYNWINGGLCHQTGTPWLNAEYSAGSYDCRVPWPSGPVIKGIALGLTTAPGAGNSRTVTLLKNSASSGLSVTVSGTSTFGIGAGEVAPADFDLLSLYATTSGSPASSTGSIALFGEVQTPVVRGAEIVVPRFAPAIFV